jgi:glycosyltransferase involved in cell wall biosynthesis
MREHSVMDVAPDPASAKQELSAAIAQSPIAPAGSLPTRCISVVIPVYNEAHTIDFILERVIAQPCVAEIIVVDDASSDATWQKLQCWQSDRSIRIFQHERNRGKGAAVRTGLQAIAAPVVIIQDADLEYDPADYMPMLELIRTGKADIVYGSRFARSQLEPGPAWHSLGNRLLTFISNCATGLRLTDSATCYKMFRSHILAQIQLKEDRFGFCPEVTAKAARLGMRFAEIPICYKGRTISEGKKIRASDGLDALRCIIEYNFIR